MMDRYRIGAVRNGSVAGAAIASLVAAACGPELPVSEPYPEAIPPRVVEEGAVPLVEHATPAESLFVYTDVAPRAALLFFQGRGVSRDREGNGYVPDGDGSRVLVLDANRKVAGSIGGPDDEQGGLGLPLSVAAMPDGAVFVVDVEHPKGLLYYDADGKFVGASTPPLLNGNVSGGPDGTLWAARSPYIYGFEPTPEDEPLLYRFNPFEGEGVGIAAIEPVAAPEWNRLANAGPIVVGENGVAYFAFLLRNELRAYAPDGELMWRTRRALGFETQDMRVERVGGELQLRLRPVTQALAIGPDGLLYALTAADSVQDPGATEPLGRRRVEVYDPATGDLLRATSVPAAWSTIAVDVDGRVYPEADEAILATAPPAVRPLLPEVELETFDGTKARFEDYRGRALLVNFWASWCLPCREEIPQLAEYYETLDRDYVEFLAISDDEDEMAARAFAAEMGMLFPTFLGRGRMQPEFHYVALPYTLVVDYRGRIVEEFYGFGSRESWERLTGRLEKEIGRARPGEADDHDHTEADATNSGHDH